LIEQRRTNSWTYSEQPSQSPWTQTNITVTENNVTSPDGNLTGALLSSSSAGNNYAYQTHIENVPTFTIYAKAGTTNNLWVRLQSDVEGRNVSYNFNLSDGTFSVATGNTGNLTGWTERKSITNAGNGWYRIEMGFTSSTTSPTTDYQISPSIDGSADASGETVYIWGAQLEKGKTFPTSYIPTTSSTVTRSSDVASITGTNFSSWFNSSEGTIVSNSVAAADASFTYTINNGTNSNRLGLNIGTNYGQPFATVSGTAYVWGTAPTLVAGGGLVAFGYKASDYAAYGDATALTGTNPTSVPTGLNELAIGFRGTYLQDTHLNGHISRLTYWPKRLTDTSLQYLTQ
jgi:hypothetical protein